MKDGVPLSDVVTDHKRTQRGASLHKPYLPRQRKANIKKNEGASEKRDSDLDNAI